MSPPEQANINWTPARVESRSILSANLKPAAIHEALRHLLALVNTILRKKRCEVGIVVVSDLLK